MKDKLSLEYFDSGLKDNGDYVWNSTGDITEKNRASDDLTISASYKFENFSYLINLHNYHESKKTYLTFDTYNKNAISDISSFNSFEQLIIKNFSPYFEIISNISDSIYSGIYFRYRDNIHLNESGGNKHSTFLGTCLKKFVIE